MQGITKYAANGAPKEVAPRTFRFVASTGERDRDGDQIEPSGWKLDNYLRNPVILLGHDYGSAPVARASRVWVERGSLMVDVLFPSDGASEASDEAFALIAEGFLRAVSVGFRPLEREPLPDGRGFRYTSVELLKISLVSVPSNASALLAARFGGKEHAKAQLRELVAKAEARRVANLVREDDRPLYVDGHALTPARLARILGEMGREARSSRFVVTREMAEAAIRAAVRDAVGTEIRKHTGRLD